MPELCILHANCQGDALRPLLENTPAFANHFSIAQYTNYIRQPVPEEEITHCRLFLYQYLDSKWGTSSSDHLLKLLPDGCQAIQIPNLFFKGYWPCWTNDTKEIDFADAVLETLLARGLNDIEILHVYESGALLGNVASTAEQSLRHEEKKEAGCPIQCAHILREFWQQEQLFLTVNHPAPRLIFHVADSLLHLLDLGHVPKAIQKAYVHPDGNFWLPLHPALHNLLGLPFASKERKYRIFDKLLTHKEYTCCYLACRRHNVRNLAALLHGLSKGVSLV